MTNFPTYTKLAADGGAHPTSVGQAVTSLGKDVSDGVADAQAAVAEFASPIPDVQGKQQIPSFSASTMKNIAESERASAYAQSPERRQQLLEDSVRRHNAPYYTQMIEPSSSWSDVWNRDIRPDFQRAVRGHVANFLPMYNQQMYELGHPMRALHEDAVAYPGRWLNNFARGAWADIRGVPFTPDAPYIPYHDTHPGDYAPGVQPHL